MLTRGNSTSTLKTSTIKDNSNRTSTIKDNNRKPLTDKTNNENTSGNMKPRKNEKPTLGARQTRKNSVKQNENKNQVGLDKPNTNNLKSKNARKLKKKIVVNEMKATLKAKVKDNAENEVKNNLLELDEDKNAENTTNENKRLNIRRRSSRLSIETKTKTTLKSNKGSSKSTKDTLRLNNEIIKSKNDVTRSNKDVISNKDDLGSNKDSVSNKDIPGSNKDIPGSKKDVSRSNEDTSRSDKEVLKFGTVLQENQQSENIDNLINKVNKKIETEKNDNSDKENKENKENTTNVQNTLNVKRRSSRFSSETVIKTAPKSKKNIAKSIKVNSKIKYTSKPHNKEHDAGSTENSSRSNKDSSKLDTIPQENLQQTNGFNNTTITQNDKIESNKTKRRSSRISSDTRIKATSKSNKDAPKSNKNASRSNKDTSRSNRNIKSNEDILKFNEVPSKSNEDSSKSNEDPSKSNEDPSKSNEDTLKLDTNLQKTSETNSPKIRQSKELKADKFVETNEQNKEKKNTTAPLKPKRLLDLKSPSPENSDPYEFKFDPKEEEPKRKPKKRKKLNKFDTLSDTSDEEDNSMKPIVKKIRKIDQQQKIHLTPVERKLRNRIVKVERQAGLVTQIKPKSNVKNSAKIAKNANVVNVTPAKVVNTPPATDKSVLDEINEIANTFLEDDDEFNDSNVSISTPSRIDIISNLIARKSIKNPPVTVFNSTMIHETPQPQQNLSPALQSPWRLEVSAIPRKSLNFSVKNKSFTPSYTPEVMTDNKKQSTLLGFVNRTPKPDLQVTLFQNSPTRKPFENLSNSMSPIRSNRSGVSAAKRSDDSLFGFTVLSDSEDKENSPVITARIKSPRNKKIETFKSVEKKQIHFDDVQIHEPALDISIPLFEDLGEKRNEKRYSRQYTRPQTKRKRNVSLKNDSSDDSDSETEIQPIKKKQKDVLTKEEAEEAERLASHYNSYFEEIENYPLCIE